MSTESFSPLPIRHTYATVSQALHPVHFLSYCIPHLFVNDLRMKLNFFMGILGTTLQITGSKNQSEERAAHFTVRVHLSC
jgi:hypothetical protein